ncbi:methyltransferase [Nocardioides sp. MAH-18]|uniref:Methyltransferase n=1 Tax=Nocardioides agri TaxID=2682843 RepID=A0A6L6XLM9_9ACTN|nr:MULTISPECIES: methyltransferase domain-containing protein [unclassified Nocardioides]MBA2953281.1 class I SAM-dependent methyltransferase [Nocardioides sp. CGMCC 1.13656]MVQ48149.1 methyltransferase [Nocardioides sp. MAH-18]
MTVTSLPREIDFDGLRIQYDARVLEPRPWTAAQSRWAAELLATAPAGPVLELCAGAGQIGLRAVVDTDRHLVCVDACAVACDYARQNAAGAGLSDRVDVREGRMQDVLGDDERFALVVADPPWVRRSDVGRYPEDPVTAIDGGLDGMDVAQACLDIAWRHVLPGGTLLLQLGTVGQVDLLTGAEPSDVRIFDRGVVARIDFG